MEQIMQYDAEFLTLDGITEDGLLFCVEDAERAAEVFIREGVDGIFVPHCNFGSEESTARLCSLVKKPVLLWGPKDYINEEDGYRYRDSQCGLFATSKVLQMYKVPFSYIENCEITDGIFEKEFQKFLSVVSVVREFKHMRIGQIGTRPGTFASVKCNEMELLETFGIEIIPITMADLKQKFESYYRDNKDEILDQAEKLKKTFTLKEVNESDLERIAALKGTVEQWAVQEHLSAAVTMCWQPMIDITGIAPCFVLGDVCDDGFPFICESDIHGAVTAVMAMAAVRYEIPMFLADITIRHPENKNGELLWHCGVFAKSLAKEGQELSLARHYNRLCPAVGEWELKDGDISVLRFDGCNGNYSLFLGEAQGTQGPRTVGSYVWIEVDDWPKWEKKLIYGPYVHHCVGIHKKVADILEEACRYIPGLQADRV